MNQTDLHSELATNMSLTYSPLNGFAIGEVALLAIVGVDVWNA